MPVVGAIAAIGGGLIQAGAAKSAAKSQSRAADQQLALQERVYDETTQNFAPYRQAGGAALDAFMYEMGLADAPTIGGQPLRVTPVTTTTPGGGREYGPADKPFLMAQYGLGGMLDRMNGGTTAPATATQYRVGGRLFGTLDEANAWAEANPTGGRAYGGFTATPGYQFRVDQGNASVNALAGARGGLNSGRTMQDLMKFGQGIASDEYGNYMNRLAGLTDMGQAAAGNQAQAGNAFAAGASNALGARGNAQAAGSIGVGNAINGAINNGIGIWQYQNGLRNGAVG